MLLIYTNILSVYGLIRIEYTSPVFLLYKVYNN